MRRFLIMFGAALFVSVGCVAPVMTLAATPSSWDSLLAKARAEGSVTVAGPGTVTARRSLTKAFEDRYGIRVEYDGSRGSDQRTQIINQRAAGIHQTDVWITGFGTFEGMDEAESEKFVNTLLRLAIKPAVTHRHKWRPGDMVLWDNRCLLHKANGDYDHSQTRYLYRVMLKGDTPF